MRVWTSKKPVIFEIGMPKTATRSVAAGAMWLHPEWNVLHGIQQRQGRQQRATQLHLLTSGYLYRDALLFIERYDYFGGWPVAMWPLLLERFPQAKFICTQRPFDSWKESAMKRSTRTSKSRASKMAAGDAGHGLALFRLSVFGSILPNELWCHRYLQHNATVSRVVPRERLLIWNPWFGDGWEKLQQFIGGTIPPDMLMPRVASRVQFNQQRKLLRKRRS